MPLIAKITKRSYSKSWGSCGFLRNPPRLMQYLYHLPWWQLPSLALSWHYLRIILLLLSNPMQRAQHRQLHQVQPRKWLNCPPHRPLATHAPTKANPWRSLHFFCLVVSVLLFFLFTWFFFYFSFLFATTRLTLVCSIQNHEQIVSLRCFVPCSWYWVNFIVNVAWKTSIHV